LVELQVGPDRAVFTSEGNLKGHLLAPTPPESWDKADVPTEAAAGVDRRYIGKDCRGRSG